MPPPKPSDIVPNGWNEYKRLVLAELERLDKSVSQLAIKHDESTRSLERVINSSREAVISQVIELINGASDRIENLSKDNDEGWDKMDQRVRNMEDDMLSIKTKAAVWGGLAAILLSLITWSAKEFVSLLHR